MEKKSKYKKKQEEPESNSFMLPRNEELEREVIGAIMFAGGNCLDEIGTLLTPYTFYEEKHGKIFRALSEMQTDCEPISLLSVAEKLRREGILDSIGGVSYLTDIANKSYTTTNLVYNAQILHQLEMGRKMCEVCERGLAMISSGEDVADVMEIVEHGLTDMTVSVQIKVTNMFDATQEFYKHIQQKAYGECDYVSTGLDQLDNVMCGGFHNSELIVFGGRPGNGKTGLSLHFARHIAEQGKKVLFFNIEMTTDQLIGRLASDGIAYDRLRMGTLDDNEFNQLEYNLSKLREIPLYISSDCNTYAGIISEARRMKRKEGLDMIVMDYLQLIRLGFRMERRQLEIGYMTSGFKALAKELDVPILLLSQLSRPANGEALRKPRLTDLRESGDIEQDADVVIFTHRPEPDTNDENFPGKSWFRRGQLVIAKQREGARDVDVVYAHDPYFKKFADDGLEPAQWECGTFKYAKHLPTEKIDMGKR